MNKMIAIFCVCSLAAGLASCAGAPVDTGHSAAEQRANAAKAHGELSNEVRK